MRIWLLIADQDRLLLPIPIPFTPRLDAEYVLDLPQMAHELAFEASRLA